MRELVLGLRLLFGSGPGHRARFLLMTLGSSLGVCCLAIVLAIPGILDAQDARVTARQPVTPRDPSGAAVVDGYPVTLARTDPYGSTPLTRVFAARGTRTVEPPPGLRSFPRDGQVFVSPRLHELLRHNAALAQLVPGGEAGLIGPAGLARPDELIAYVGMSRAELPDGDPVERFGESHGPLPTLDPTTLAILRFTLAAVVLLPLVVFLSVCARLSAADRARRLAALRLLGLSKKGTQRVNAAETVAAAGLGAILGLGEYWAANQLVSRVGLPGFTWYPADGALTFQTLAVCLVGCPALAWYVGRASAGKAAADPLAVRRGAVEKAPPKWVFLPLVAGLGVIAGYCVAGVTRHAPKSTALSAWLMPSAALLSGVGLALSLPACSRFLAQRMARSTRSFSLGLAMRRNEAEPGGAVRVATGLVLLVFAASLAQGVVIQLDSVARSPLPVQTYDIQYGQLSGSQRQAIEVLPGVRAHVVTLNPPLSDSLEQSPRPGGVVATCGELRKAVRWTEGCVDGRLMRLWDPGQPQDVRTEAGDEVLFDRRVGQRSRDLSLKMPRQTVRYREHEGLVVLRNGGVLVPPTSLPPDAIPREATLTLVSGPGEKTVRTVLDGIGAIAPTAGVITSGLNVDAFQEVTIVKTLLAVGMILGLVIGVAAYLVAATDRAVERRPQVTALTLLGARTRTLRAAQVAQVVSPLLVGLVPALVVGKLAESSYLVIGGGPVLWDGAGIPVLLACALGVVAVAAVGALPLAGRRIDPELIRRH
ncbi:FtsX-like permease family protein [Streptomyces sp. LN704]|uniref:FtsX-like permease family protein n=1 Tax=unclassified Streptomyces TaxID=2593676 RepID=UPI00371F7F9F